MIKSRLSLQLDSYAHVSLVVFSTLLLALHPGVVYSSDLQFQGNTAAARTSGSQPAPSDSSNRQILLPPLSREDTRSLLNWATFLSEYSEEDGAYALPDVVFEASSYFVDQACSGQEPCRVLGWYADRGVIHMDERLADMSSLFARSLVLHELVHYLQHVSGRFTANDCGTFVRREREAYAIQQAYFVAYGAIPAMRIHHFNCPYNRQVVTTSQVSD